LRAEDILEAVKTKLTGLTTTGSNVQREQSYDIEQDDLPFIIITEGEDVVEGQSTQSYLEWVLTVDIDILAREGHSTVVTLMNTIRGEVHTALMADFTLGLSYVKYISAVRADNPTVSPDGDRPIIKQRLTYEIRYRSNWANLD